MKPVNPIMRTNHRTVLILALCARRLSKSRILRAAPCRIAFTTPKGTCYLLLSAHLLAGGRGIAAQLAQATPPSPPTITLQPVDQRSGLFADATFRALAAGDAPLTYQWRLNGNELPGMTNSTLSVTNVQRLAAGNYDLIVTNSSGSSTSRVATLTIVPFNAIYCFGFSWTGSRGCNLAPLNSYWHGQPSNGPQWPEYLSTNLDLAYAPENNYAHCGATPQDILNQVVGYRVPSKPALSLYCLFLSDIPVTSNTVHRLYTKGARTILVEGQFDITFHGSFTNDLEAMKPFNAEFIEAMRRYSQTKPDVRILFVDLLPKFEEVLASPAEYGFTKVNIDALDDNDLADKSFTGPGADYLFWDPGHPTTKLHRMIADWHLEVLRASILETLEVNLAGGAPDVQMKHLQIGRDYTLQRSSDLTHWSEAQAFTASAGTNHWAGQLNPTTAEFFRLQWQPWDGSK
jgi:hypothetical protein